MSYTSVLSFKNTDSTLPKKYYPLTLSSLLISGSYYQQVKNLKKSGSNPCGNYHSNNLTIF